MMMMMVKAKMTKKKYGKEMKKKQRGPAVSRGHAQVGVQQWLVTGRSGLFWRK